MFIFSSIFSIICTLVLPLTLTIIFCVRKKESWKPILFGTLTFVVFQVLLRIPLLELVVSKTAWFESMSSSKPFMLGLFLSSTAALFEEGGRYIVMSLFLKKQRSPLDGIAFGLGHGGIEAILLVGINSVALLFLSEYVAQPSMIMAAGVERISAILLHIGFSVMVIKSLREKKILWLFIAFILHTLFNFITVIMLDVVNIWLLEAILLIIALTVSLFVIREYKNETLGFGKAEKI